MLLKKSCAENLYNYFENYYFGNFYYLYFVIQKLHKDFYKGLTPIFNE